MSRLLKGRKEKEMTLLRFVGLALLLLFIGCATARRPVEPERPAPVKEQLVQPSEKGVHKSTLLENEPAKK